MPTVADAHAYMDARFGPTLDPVWLLTQSYCANNIFHYESDWDPHATNPSGSYGIPQANPASKMGDWAMARSAAAAAAGDTTTAWLYAAWRDNPVVQVEWGLDYMVRRYGSPCNAFAFRSGYYDPEGVFHSGHGWY
jgi:hypothetical protein